MTIQRPNGGQRKRSWAAILQIRRTAGKRAQLKTETDSTRTGKESTAGAKHDLAWMDWMDPAMCVLAVLVESRASLAQGVVGLSCPFLDD